MITVDNLLIKCIYKKNELTQQSTRSTQDSQKNKNKKRFNTKINNI